MRSPTVLAITTASAVLMLAACGSSSSSSPASSGSATPAATSGGSSAPQPSSSSGAGALVPEAQAVAAGDIPDNQVFLSFRDASAGYSMKYPEGWAQHGSGNDVTLQDKNNVIHVVVERGPATVAQAKADMARLAAANPKLTSTAPVAHPSCTRNGATVPLPRAAVALRYTTTSAPNPVTGKRVKLIVDRYELARGTMRAVVDLGTPQGVDNVDAYCLIISSFTWR